MKLILTILVVVFSSFNFAANKWDIRDCGKIEVGVSQLIKATGSMKDVADAAGKNGDSEAENKFRDQQLFYLESAGHWAIIYSTFCKE
tara:strand:+ start:2632 stop:2895 length:264 start_codon:yes stop_codon:yes gene_type:complete